jgi:hypothetical protein
MTVGRLGFINVRYGRKGGREQYVRRDLLSKSTCIRRDNRIKSLSSMEAHPVELRVVQAFLSSPPLFCPFVLTPPLSRLLLCLPTVLRALCLSLGSTLSFSLFLRRDPPASYPPPALHYSIPDEPSMLRGSSGP